MRLTTTREWPPEGWSYMDPKTGYREPAPMSNNFDTVAKGIQRARANNPAHYPAAQRTNEAARNALTTYTVLRLIRRGLWDRVIIEEGDEAVLSAAGVDSATVKKKLNQQSQLTEVVGDARPAESGNRGGILRQTKQLAGGVALLRDWTGTGSPVSPELANKRAAVCVECPLNNRDPNWIDKLTTETSEAVRSQMELKLKLNLATHSDEQLGVCDACLCPMKLKVWVPIKFIQKHTEDETYWALHPKCWILAEA